MSDNFHQSIQGGTGANHVALGTGDAVWFSDGKGKPVAPPTLNIENPDPAAGTNNWYTQDGYSGGTYSDCADDEQPGVAAVDELPEVDARQAATASSGHYYLLNNYTPGYFGDGSVNSDQFTIPPSSLRTIGDELDRARHLLALLRRRLEPLPRRSRLQLARQRLLRHLQSVPVFDVDHDATPTVRTSHLKDTIDLYADIDERLAAGGLDRQAERPARRPSGVVEARPVRGLHQEDRRPDQAPSQSCGRTPPSSSPSTRAAATTTRATSSRSTSSATARASR